MSGSKKYRPVVKTDQSRVGLDLWSEENPITPFLTIGFQQPAQTPNHLLCFHFVGCEKETNNLINHPVVSLLGNRVGGTKVRIPHGTARVPHVRLCGQFTSQPHVWYGILGTRFSLVITTRAPHVRLSGEFTSQPHVRYVILPVILVPTQETKNVCQRLGDKDSSLRWDLIWPRQHMGSKFKTSLGVSSFSDSKFSISVYKTDSSTGQFIIINR
jgi:hypothetical protein